MLLFRGSNVYQPRTSPEDLQAVKEKMFRWLSELSERGSHVGSEPFETTGKLVSGVTKQVMDRPYGSAEEIVGGCTIVQAKGLNDALEMAKSCPILETNATIEVRPIQKIA